jgi:hypothetical protein
MRWKWLLAAVPVAYLGFLGVTYAQMKRPPGEFARYMSGLPRPAMYAIPFPPMWSRARAGVLELGDAAPDFELATVDKQAKVKLSEFRRDRPVLLIFGSYT